MRNRYICVRHGKSEANEAGIIVSDVNTGSTAYDLVPLGIKQAEKTAHELKQLLSNSRVQIHSSPFTRARTTANIIRQISFPDSEPVIVTPTFRERFFGKFELTPDSNYQTIWGADDMHDTKQLLEWNCELTEQVLERTTGYIDHLESTTKDTVHIIVSHGDAIQIVQTKYAQIGPHKHRSMPHVDTAGWRELKPLY